MQPLHTDRKIVQRPPVGKIHHACISDYDLAKTLTTIHFEPKRVVENSLEGGLGTLVEGDVSCYRLLADRDQARRSDKWYQLPTRIRICFDIGH